MGTGAPIVLLGTGRCGSTVLYEMLSHHPDLAWFSGAMQRWPGRPDIHRRMMTWMDRGLDRWLRPKLHPDEAYGYWQQKVPGFAGAYRDLAAADASMAQSRDFAQAFEDAKTSRRQTTMLKTTGWPRLGFMEAALDEARFVHVVRDGRAVAASMLRVSWWEGWKGPDRWSWGPLPEHLDEEWHASGHSFPALAGLQWRMLVDAFDATRPMVPAERLLELRYEDLCADPDGTRSLLMDFLALDDSKRFRDAWSHFRLRDTNDKWRLDLNAGQQAAVEQAAGPTLASRGYN